MRINNAVIEITRECNLRCDHCMRGTAQKLDIEKRYIDSFFSQVSEVGCLNISGGEPLLKLELMRYVLDSIRTYNVDVENFYLATNGTVATDEVIRILIDYWTMCSQNEISCVHLSNDEFHDIDAIYEAYEKLSALRFVEKKWEKDFYDYENYNYIIKQGRGMNFRGRWNQTYDFDIDEADVYLNAEGNIINGCDWSFDDQDGHKICHVDDLHKYEPEEEEE